MEQEVPLPRRVQRVRRA